MGLSIALGVYLSGSWRRRQQAAVCGGGGGGGCRKGGCTAQRNTSVAERSTIDWPHPGLLQLRGGVARRPSRAVAHRFYPSPLHRLPNRVLDVISCREAAAATLVRRTVAAGGAAKALAAVLTLQ